MQSAYEMSNEHLRLTAQFANLCGEQSNIEAALRNGVPDCDKSQLARRLAEVRRQLEQVRKNLEQSS